MSINMVEVAEVTCQKCGATILVREWQQAAEHGWAVPCDGLLQLCPDCIPKHKAELFAKALQADLETVLGPHSAERINKAANALLGRGTMT